MTLHPHLRTRTQRRAGRPLCAGDDLQQRRDAHRATADGRRVTLNGIPLGLDGRLGPHGLERSGWRVCPAGDVDRGAEFSQCGSAATLIPHPSDQTSARHRYPAAPWDRATIRPILCLPVDAVARESLRWVEARLQTVFVPARTSVCSGSPDRGLGCAGPWWSMRSSPRPPLHASVASLYPADTGQQIESAACACQCSRRPESSRGASVEYQDGSITRLGLVRSTRKSRRGMPEVWADAGSASLCANLCEQFRAN